MRRGAVVLWQVLQALVSIAMVAALLGAIALMAIPRATGVKPVIVLTGSMEPVLMTGGLAFLAPLPAGEDPTVELQVGDIITFRSPKSPKNQISHRIIGIVDSPEGRAFKTKGDNSQQPDPFDVPAENVVGTIDFHLPYLGWIADWMRHRESFYVLVGIPVAIVVIAESQKIVRELRVMRSTAQPVLSTLHRSFAVLAGGSNQHRSFRTLSRR